MSALPGSALPGSGSATAAAARRSFDAFGATLSMIKFQHTLFALPFAFTAAILAARGLPPPATIGWILGAMVGARSAAMVWNRIADLEFDRRNPRTASRPLVTGELGLPFAWAFLFASLALFYLSASRLNALALLLATPAALVILSYSYAKRVTWLTHLHLGASLGLAPIGAWVGVTGRIEAAPLLLGLAVTCWVAGFDILYGCQDIDFDRRARLQSIPARFGLEAALRASALLHLVTVVLLAALPLVWPLGMFWTTGVALVAALLFYEHRLVRPDDLSRVNAAFFTVNGVVGFVLLAAAAAEVFFRRA
jgi:4-hydroxybenzoate polyprenyltransferase